MATERRLGPWEAVRRSAPLPAAGFVGRGGRSATVTRPPVSSRAAEDGGDRKAWDPGRRYGVARRRHRRLRCSRRSLCDRHETPPPPPVEELVEEVALRPSRDPDTTAGRGARRTSAEPRNQDRFLAG